MEQETPESEKQKPPEIPPEIIKEAMDTGWIPEDQFKGDKSKWRPADQWVERGRSLIPLIKTQVKDYKSEIDSLKATVESQKKTTERLLKMSEKTQEMAYEKAKRELAAKQMEAVKEGDTEKWALLKEEEDKLKPPEKMEIEQQPQPQNSPDFDAWYPNNKWYRAIGSNEGDTDLTIYADAYSASLLKTNPNMTHAELLSKTSEKVKQVFPHKFENPARNLPSAVDGGSQRETGLKTGGKTFNDLPADAKTMCNQDIKNGLYKTKEDWVKVYFEEA